MFPGSEAPVQPRLAPQMCEIAHKILGTPKTFGPPLQEEVVSPRVRLSWTWIHLSRTEASWNATDLVTPSGSHFAACLLTDLSQRCLGMVWWTIYTPRLYWNSWQSLWPRLFWSSHMLGRPSRSTRICKPGEGLLLGWHWWSQCQSSIPDCCIAYNDGLLTAFCRQMLE